VVAKSQNAADLYRLALQQMPANVLRHSFGTYFYHSTKSEAETAYTMGNTPDIALNWYKSQAVEDEDVTNWWAVTPAAAEAYLQGCFDLEKFV